MAVKRTLKQVLFGSSPSTPVNSGSERMSNPVEIDEKAIGGSVQVKAAQGGTPSSGDELMVKLVFSNGDPDTDPDATDEFDSYQHAPPRMLDMATGDPAIKSFPIPPWPKSFRIYFQNEGAAPIEVSAQYSEKTA